MATQKQILEALLQGQQSMAARIEALETGAQPSAPTTQALKRPGRSQRKPQTVATDLSALSKLGIATNGKPKQDNAPLTAEIATGNDSRGNPGITIRFSRKPAQAVRDAIGRQGLGWGWGRTIGAWYKSTASGMTVEDIRAEAEEIVRFAQQPDAQPA